MPEKIVYVYLLEGYADWEISHVLPELRRTGGYEVRAVSLDGKPVVSMGGLTVQPAGDLATVDPDKAAIFILPGSAKWTAEPIPAALAQLLRTLDAKGVALAAACAATTVVARLGLLRGREHTSNALQYLVDAVPEYQEEANYVDDVAVRDRGLITASGLGDIEFASEIFAELKVMDDDIRNNWEVVFRTTEIPDGFFDQEAD